MHFLDSQLVGGGGHQLNDYKTQKAIVSGGSGKMAASGKNRPATQDSTSVEAMIFGGGSKNKVGGRKSQNVN